ncbi:MAG: FAD-dependent oxidoreductase, partial [Kiritimatiellia bacterium]
TFRRGNVFLCGDSGHVMSPIGGQGMNTGFGDAMMLSEILQHPDPAAQAAYTRERRRAFRIAARRAALGMWLGTRKGPAASLLRAWGLKTGLRAPWTQQTLVRSFSMRNLPHPCNP